jgi:cytochrome c556
MKRISFALLCAVAALAATTYVSTAGPDEAAHLTARPPLPASLDNYYPPKVPQPQYLLDMIGLAESFMGIVCDLFDEDLPNARANFEQFKVQYETVAAMVPEWQEAYPAAPVEALGRALQAGDPAAVMAAVDEVGAVCHNCHLGTMVAAQQKYRWDKFSDISAVDPLAQEDVEFAQLMRRMEVSMVGIGMNLKRGQTENALKHLHGFEARFRTVSETCWNCHESERTYFTDPSIFDRIEKLKIALAEPNVDGAAAGALLQEIGQESCSKCHLVHLPAAYSLH